MNPVARIPWSTSTAQKNLVPKSHFTLKCFAKVNQRYLSINFSITLCANHLYCPFFIMYSNIALHFLGESYSNAKTDWRKQYRLTKKQSIFVPSLYVSPFFKFLYSTTVAYNIHISSFEYISCKFYCNSICNHFKRQKIWRVLNYMDRLS